MSRVGIWVLNGALFVLCCFLTANLVNGWLGEWLAGPPVAAPPPKPAEARVARSWSDREVILKRNLFQVSTLLPTELSAEDAAAAAAEQLEATKLPLKLLGTVAASGGAQAWAAVEDTQGHSQIVVRLNDTLLDRATVLRIERRRIVLQNGAKREELALDETEQAAGIPDHNAGNGDQGARIQRVADNQYQVQRDDVEKAVRNPAELFSQARILPKYENGQMTGVQLNSIQPGSLFEQIGIRNGDVITQVNGIVVSSPQDSAKLLSELTSANQFEVGVVGADGQTRTLSYTVQQ
jgi:general secretion pathway protein C